MQSVVLYEASTIVALIRPFDHAPACPIPITALMPLSVPTPAAIPTADVLYEASTVQHCSSPDKGF